MNEKTIAAIKKVSDTFCTNCSDIKRRAITVMSLIDFPVDFTVVPSTQYSLAGAEIPFMNSIILDFENGDDYFFRIFVCPKWIRAVSSYFEWCHYTDNYVTALKELEEAIENDIKVHCRL